MCLFLPIIWSSCVFYNELRKVPPLKLLCMTKVNQLQHNLMFLQFFSVVVIFTTPPPPPPPSLWLLLFQGWPSTFCPLPSLTKHPGVAPGFISKYKPCEIKFLHWFFLLNLICFDTNHVYHVYEKKNALRSKKDMKYFSNMDVRVILSPVGWGGAAGHVFDEGKIQVSRKMDLIRIYLWQFYWFCLWHVAHEAYQLDKGHNCISWKGWWLLRLPPPPPPGGGGGVLTWNWVGVWGWRFSY